MDLSVSLSILLLLLLPLIIRIYLVSCQLGTVISFDYLVMDRVGIDGDCVLVKGLQFRG